LAQQRRTPLAESGVTPATLRVYKGHFWNYFFAISTVLPYSTSRTRTRFIMAAKYWMFTINNPAKDERLVMDSNVSYCVYQLEVGANGTPHFQGYVELVRKQRLSWMKRKFDARAHFEIRRGTQEEAMDYCMKEDTRVEGPFIFGTPRINEQGARNDIVAVQQRIREGADNYDLWTEFPEFFVRYSKAANEYRTEWAQRQQRETVEQLQPLPGWQTDLYGDLTGPVSRRKVIWIYDLIGNIGKSTFAARYRPNATFIVSGGKHEDIMYAFSQALAVEVVFFDYGRDQETVFPYRLLEKFKDGCFLSSKYVSRMVRFPTPHVVVLANFAPDKNKLSQDRWDIREI